MPYPLFFTERSSRNLELRPRNSYSVVKARSYQVNYISIEGILLSSGFQGKEQKKRERAPTKKQPSFDFGPAERFSKTGGSPSLFLPRDPGKRERRRTQRNSLELYPVVKVSKL